MRQNFKKLKCKTNEVTGKLKYVIHQISAKRIIALFLVCTILLTFMPSFRISVNADYVPEGDVIVGGNKVMDIYLNLDSATGYNLETVVNKIKDKLIAGTKNGVSVTQNDFRIRSNVTTIDTTDLSSWYIYDHYDTAYWGGGTTENPPANWINFYGQPTAKRHFFPVTDSYGSLASLKTYIEEGRSLGSVQKYDNHIYSYKDANGLPAMTFVGYGYSANTDYLFYPADNITTKKVSFDVNASDVKPHSLSEAGFLINTGVETVGSVDYIKGYIITYAFSPVGSSTSATGISAVKLYKINNNVTPAQLHNAVSAGGSTIANTGLVTLAATAVTPTFNASKMNISLEIAPTTLKAYHTTTGGGKQTLFDTNLTNTGFGGFGPFVAYTVSGHTCQTTSSFKFTNLQMSLEDAGDGSTPSVLDALNKSDYLMNSEKYFVNILNTDNSSALNQKDWEGIARLRQDEVFYVTNKKNSVLTDGGVVNPGKNGQNGKSILTYSDINDLTTQIANYILGTNSWVAPVTELQITKPVGICYLQGVDNDAASKQLDVIVNNYISAANGFNIYAVDQSEPGKTGVTVIPISEYTFVLKYPEASKLPDQTITIPASSYPVNGIFNLFKLPKTTPIGDYTVIMTVKDSNNQTSNPTYRTFQVITDSTPPVVDIVPNPNIYSQAAPYDGVQITVNASDIGGEKVKAYEFGTTANDSSSPVYGIPTVLPTELDSTSFNYILPSGKYKLFVKVYDKAGNFTEKSIWANPKINTISYNLNGGTGTLGDPQLYRFDETVNLSDGTGISMNNATFKGWANSLVSPILSPNSIAISKQNTLLYAIWQTNLRATYNTPFYFLVDASPQIPAGTIAEYTIVKGTLPAGLTLNSAMGSISGSPTSDAGASYEFDVQIKYQETTIVKKYSIKVEQQHVPNPGGEELKGYILEDKAYYGDTVNLEAVGGYGSGAYSFAVDPSSSAMAKIENGNKVKLTGVGTVVINATKAADANYSEQHTTVTFYANKRVLTPTAIAQPREYNGSKSVDVQINLDHVALGDTVTANGTGNMTTADAGGDKLVQVSEITLDAVSQAKYALSTTYVQTGVEITRKPISALTFRANSKEYDGTNLVRQYTVSPNGLVMGDDVAVSGTALFDNTTVNGATKAVFTPSGLTGTKAQNYSLTATTVEDKTAKIEKAEVIFSSSNNTYVYDGNAHAAEISATIKSTGAVLANDKYTVSYTKELTTFPDAPKEVGVYTVNANITDANYSGALPATKITIGTAEQTPLGINGIPNNIVEFGDEFDVSIFGGTGEGAINITATNALVTGSKIKVTGTGTVTITATKAADANHGEQQAAASFTAQRKTVTFSITNNEYTYDGAPKSATVTPSVPTLTAGADYEVSGATQTNAGEYDISVDVSNPNYRGKAEGTLTIKKATSHITGLSIENTTYGTAIVGPTAAAIGGTISYTYIGDGIATETATKPTNAGNYTVIATLTGDANHEDCVETKNFYISKKTLTLTADNQIKVYGEINPPLTVNYSGFADSDNESSLYLKPIATTNASTTSAVGEYDINVSGGYDKNYTFSYVKGTLTINSSSQMPFAIGGIPDYVTYGDEFRVYAIGDIAGGTVTFRSLNDNASVAGDTVTVLHKGDIVIEATKTMDNFITETVTKTFYANPKTVTFAITNTVQTYTGSALYATVTPSISGYADYTVTYSGNQTDVGEYPITVAVTNADYTGSASGKLNITPSDVKYKILCDDKTYDGAVLAPTVENVDASRVVYIFNGSPLAPKDAGAYEIVAHIAANGNEPSATIAKVVKINRKQITVTGTKQTKLYGEVNPAFTYTYSGFIDGEDENVLTQKPVAVTQATTYTEAGRYDILFDGADAVNYSFIYQKGELEILSADYDGLRIINVPSYISYQDTFDLSVLGGKGNGAVTYESSDASIAKITGNRVEIVGVGTVTLTATKASDGNYKIQTAEVSFTSVPKVITVTATAKNRDYEVGKTDVEVTLDTGVSGLTARYISATVLTANAGQDKEVTVKGVSLNDVRYKPASTTIYTTVTISSIADTALVIDGFPYPITYGDDDFILTASSTGTGAVTWSSSGTDVLKVSRSTGVVRITGVGRAAITATKASDANYGAESAYVELTVKPKGVTYAITNNTKPYTGAAQYATVISSVYSLMEDEDYTVTYSRYGTEVADPTETGEYDITVTTANPNYSGASTGAKLTIQAVDQTYALQIGGLPSYIEYEDTFALYANGGNGEGEVTWALEAGNDYATVDSTTGVVEVTGVGMVTVTATKAGDNNYHEQERSVTFTANKKKLSLGIGNTAKTYTGTVQVVTITGTPTKNNNLADITQISYEMQTDAVETEFRNVGTYNVNVAIANAYSEYYTLNGSAKAVATIAKSNLIITADNKTKTYGDANPELTLSYTLLGTDQDEEAIFNFPTITCTADASSVTGEYNITLSYDGDHGNSNYNITLVHGKLTVTRKALNVTANSKTISFGDAPANDGVTYGGFVNDEDSSILSGTPVYSYKAYQQGNDAGTYGDEIMPSGLTSDNYDITFTAGTLTVAPQSVTLTANGSTSNISVILSRAVRGLTLDKFILKQGKNIITPTAVTEIFNGARYTLAAPLNPDTEYTITINNGANYTIIPATFKVIAPSGGGGASAPVSTNNIITVKETSSAIFENTELIEVTADMANAFSQSVEVKITDDTETAETVFHLVGDNSKVYPFDISLYEKGKTTRVQPKSGYKVTVTLPLPKELWDVRENVQVVTVTDGKLTKLKSIPVQKDSVWCISFEAEHFSPYALILDSEWQNPYQDVVETDWFYDAVKYMSASGIMNGTGDTTFGPNISTSRAMIVTILWRLDGEPAAKDSISFEDVARDTWYTDAVAWGMEKGIVKGYDTDTFGPNNKITREQMAAILYRYARYKNYDVGQTADLNSYADSNKISSYARNAFAWAAGEKLITGMTSTSLLPSSEATRAQVAAILMRFSENVVR